MSDWQKNVRCVVVLSGGIIVFTSRQIKPTNSWLCYWRLGHYAAQLIDREIVLNNQKRIHTRIATCATITVLSDEMICSPIGRTCLFKFVPRRLYYVTEICCHRWNISRSKRSMDCIYYLSTSFSIF